MPCGVKTGGSKFRSSGYLRLVFFLYTSLGTRSASVTYFYIRSLASVVSASSKEKIPRLAYLRSNLEVKFVNLAFELAKFKNPVTLYL